MIDKWESRFLELSKLVGGWSKDPSTQVGCVLVDNKKRIVGVGFNGFPKYVQDTEERLNDRPTKYLMTQHAEINALLNSTSDPDKCTAYVTHLPCSSCCGALIQAGISKIVTFQPDAGLAERYADSFRISKIMCEEAGVDLTILP